MNCWVVPPSKDSEYAPDLWRLLLTSASHVALCRSSGVVDLGLEARVYLSAGLLHAAQPRGECCCCLELISSVFANRLLLCCGPCYCHHKLVFATDAGAHIHLLMRIPLSSCLCNLRDRKWSRSWTSPCQSTYQRVCPRRRSLGGATASATWSSVRIHAAALLHSHPDRLLIVVCGCAEKPSHGKLSEHTTTSDFITYVPNPGGLLQSIPPDV